MFHLVRRQILLEREIACDELVLGTLAAQRSTYAQALLTAVSAGAAGEPRMPLSVGVAESFHQLQRRLTIICSQMPLQAKLSRLAVVLLAALGLLSVPGIALTSRVSAADSEMASPFAQSLAATEPARNITYSGIVVDPAGVPLANVRVRLVKVSSRMALAQGTTGKDGRFTIGPVSSMNPSDRRIVSRELVFEHPDYATSCSWQVEQDTDRQDIRIRMTRPATLAGTICDPDGRPLGGALVEAWLRYWEDDTHSQLQYLSRDSGRAVVSDANGAFRFTHLPEDAKMALVVTHAQYPRYETSEDPASRPVLLAGQTDVRVSLQQGVPVALQLISQDQPLRRQGVFVVAFAAACGGGSEPVGQAVPSAEPSHTGDDRLERPCLAHPGAGALYIRGNWQGVERPRPGGLAEQGRGPGAGPTEERRSEPGDRPDHHRPARRRQDRPAGGRDRMSRSGRRVTALGPTWAGRASIATQRTPGAASASACPRARTPWKRRLSMQA